MFNFKVFLLVLYLNAYYCVVANANKTFYNTVLIIIDDMRHLPANSVTLTNIEKFSTQSVIFENCFAQQSLCAPSRNSLLTGRRPDSLRLYDFYSYWRETAGNFTTLPQFFKEFGFHTYSAGKVFHPGKSSNFTDDYPISWSYLPYHPSTEKYKDAAVCKNKHTNKPQRNLLCPVKIDSQPGGTLPDIQTVQYAVNVLKKHRLDKEPFFLAVGFHKPHIPLRYPKEYLRKVSKSQVTMPVHPEIPTGLPKVAWHPWLDVKRRDDIYKLNITFPYGIMPRKWTKKIRRHYYAAMLYIDDLVGTLLDQIDLNSTVVVLTSDHGWSLGENGLWAKYSNFDAALKVPFILRIPTVKPKTITTPVELVDLFPTLANLFVPNNNIPNCKGSSDSTSLCFEGKSLMSLINGQSTEDYVAISQYPRPSAIPATNSDKPLLKDIKIMGYSIRNKIYRYTKWVAFNHTTFKMNWDTNYGSELYDHRIDPNESNNVFLNESYKYIVKYMSMLLRAKVDP